jgi:phenylacetate-CoA ligase
MIEFSFSDFFYPSDLLNTYRLLRQSEHWTPEQFFHYQTNKLAKLLRHCAEQVPFYQNIFQSNTIRPESIFPENAFELLSQIPVLQKNFLRENSKEFCSNEWEYYKPKMISTSGTTGTPLTVYWDKGSNVMEFCSIQRLWRWAGFHPGQPFLDVRSRMMDNHEHHLIESDGILYQYNWKVRGLEFSSDLLNDQTIQPYYKILLKYRPKLVRGHPQSIVHLANLLEKHQLLGWKPDCVTTASEAVYDFQRRRIHAAWGVPVLDSYGLKEHNVFIAQCKAGSYHIFPEYGIVEILDDQEKPVGPGQEGWIVATSLHNYAQPLLRYNTLDRAIAGDGRNCPCGRTLPVIDRLVGRIDDCLITKDGTQYSGLSFAFFGLQGLHKARLTQLDYEKVIVEVVIDTSFGQSQRELLLKNLERKVNGKLTFEIKEVNEIIQETPGKYKFVVSKIPTIPSNRIAVDHHTA